MEDINLLRRDKVQIRGKSRVMIFYGVKDKKMGVNIEAFPS